MKKVNLRDTEYSKDNIYEELPQNIIDWNNREISKLEKITNLNLGKWYI